MLDLHPITLSKLQLEKVPFLYNFSPSVVPKPYDWDKWVDVTGYWFMNEHRTVEAEREIDASIPVGLKNAIANAKAQKKKIVYIGFGSVIVPNPEKMTDAVLGAVEESNVFAIISGGWTAEQAQEAKKAGQAMELMKQRIAQQPASMYYVDSVSHEWLFPRISAALHHGGAGTAAASMRAGIPTLIKPFFGDQNFWAQRVEKLGVGLHVKSLRKTDIARALRKATTDEKQIFAAKRLGDKIQSENGVDVAIRAIYDNLDYSQRYIKATRYLGKPTKSKEEVAVEEAKLIKSILLDKVPLYRLLLYLVPKTRKK